MSTRGPISSTEDLYPELRLAYPNIYSGSMYRGVNRIDGGCVPIECATWAAQSRTSDKKKHATRSRVTPIRKLIREKFVYEAGRLIEYEYTDHINTIPEVSK